MRVSEREAREQSMTHKALLKSVPESDVSSPYSNYLPHLFCDFLLATSFLSSHAGYPFLLTRTHTLTGRHNILDLTQTNLTHTSLI